MRRGSGINVTKTFTIMETVKQIPYGVADFQSVIERDLNGYAVAPRVEALRQGTQMHKIIMQFCGWELVRMEEIM